MDSEQDWAPMMNLVNVLLFFGCSLCSGIFLVNALQILDSNLTVIIWSGYSYLPHFTLKKVGTESHYYYFVSEPLSNVFGKSVISLFFLVPVRNIREWQPGCKLSYLHQSIVIWEFLKSLNLLEYWFKSYPLQDNLMQEKN